MRWETQRNHVQATSHFTPFLFSEFFFRHWFNRDFAIPSFLNPKVKNDQCSNDYRCQILLVSHISVCAIAVAIPDQWWCACDFFPLFSPPFLLMPATSVTSILYTFNCMLLHSDFWFCWMYARARARVRVCVCIYIYVFYCFLCFFLDKRDGRKKWRLLHWIGWCWNERRSVDGIMVRPYPCCERKVC